MSERTLDAAVLLIGDELLSGRTRDTNLGTLAQFLAPLGIAVRETRIVSDVQDDIVAAVQALAARYRYVFTTGGIGPTHDDITADAMAKAFGCNIDVREDARALLELHYAKQGLELNAARLRMARIPDGAKLIANPVSAAPGFQIENVFVMAGVPGVMRGMLEDVGKRLEGGAVVQSLSVRGMGLREGNIAEGLGQLAKASPELSFGSYPYYGAEGYGVTLVVRGVDEGAVRAACEALSALIAAEGITPEQVSV
jgi:molybdenum cofactor synthesis domain-containing protein